MFFWLGEYRELVDSFDSTGDMLLDLRLTSAGKLWFREMISSLSVLKTKRHAPYLDTHWLL